MADPNNHKAAGTGTPGDLLGSRSTISTTKHTARYAGVRDRKPVMCSPNQALPCAALLVEGAA